MPLPPPQPPVRQLCGFLDESGFEVYETVGWVAVQESFKSRSVLELREIEEQLQQQLYTVWGIMEEKETGTEEQREVVTSWMGHVRFNMEPLTDCLRINCTVGNKTAGVIVE